MSPPLTTTGAGDTGVYGTDPHTWANKLWEVNANIQAAILETLGPNTPVDADNDAIIAYVDIGDDGSRSPLAFTATNRSLWKTLVTPTGKSVGRFDGIDDKYQDGAVIPAAEFQSFSALFVFKATGSGGRTFVSSNATDGALQIRIGSTDKVEVLKNNIVGLGTATNAIVSGQFNVIGVTYDGTTLRFYQNRVTNGVATVSQTFTADTNSFGHSKSLEFFAGDIGYGLLCGDVKTDAEMIDAMVYLSGFWGTA